MGTLRNLQVFNAKSNAISGEIPPEIANLKKLKYFDVNNNQITGTIPAPIAELENLMSFTVENNLLGQPTPAPRPAHGVAPQRPAPSPGARAPR